MPYVDTDDKALRAAVAKLDDLCDAEHRWSLPGDTLQTMAEMAKRALAHKPN